MTQPQFSLAWDSHKSNICSGLSSLQQNGEFVDMTLAADGHMVKVHQVVMALASPYIKELISSANCSHPVIFLNKVSYEILSAILEYIYTGEVVIYIHDYNDLIQAAKELHVKGLEEMKLHESNEMMDQSKPEIQLEYTLDDEMSYYETTEQNDDNILITNTNSDDYETMKELVSKDESINSCIENSEVTKSLVKTKSETQSNSNLSNSTLIQYTVSNQGSLQMIFNRYVYYLKYCKRDKTRKWHCVDYLNSGRCPASLVTKGDIVLQRITAHNHKFHDKKILKKVHAGAVFSAIHEAEKESCEIKNNLKKFKII